MLNSLCYTTAGTVLELTILINLLGLSTLRLSSLIVFSYINKSNVIVWSRAEHSFVCLQCWLSTSTPHCLCIIEYHKIKIQSLIPGSAPSLSMVVCLAHSKQSRFFSFAKPSHKKRFIDYISFFFSHGFVDFHFPTNCFPLPFLDCSFCTSPPLLLSLDLDLECWDLVTLMGLFLSLILDNFSNRLINKFPLSRLLFLLYLSLMIFAWKEICTSKYWFTDCLTFNYY